MPTMLDPQRLSHCVEEFARDGHVCLPQYVSGAAFDELQQNLDRYIHDVVPRLPPTHAFFENRDDPATLKQMQYMQEEDSYFADFLHQEAFVDLAAALLGEEVVPRGAEYFNKPAGVGKATPPHQDGYYFCLTPNQAITFWIALDRVNHENGALRYVSGSHRDGVRPHGASEILGFSQGIQDWSDDDASREAMRILEPGDVLAHHSLTIHRADANNSDRSRRALGLVYFGKSAQVDPAAQQRYQDSVKQQHAGMGIGGK